MFYPLEKKTFRFGHLTGAYFYSVCRGPKRLHSKWANSPIFGAKTKLLDLECAKVEVLTIYKGFAIRKIVCRSMVLPSKIQAAQLITLKIRFPGQLRTN